MAAKGEIPSKFPSKDKEGDKSPHHATSEEKKGQAALGNVVPIYKQVSDVGQFSYAALCATALHCLFDTEHDRKFREEALSVILISLEQPQQVCESVRAMLQGHGQDDMDPFVDILLAEDVLKTGAEPLISELLAIAIGKGAYDARMRVLIKHIAWRLHVSWDVLSEIEAEMAETLAMVQYEMTEEEKQEKLKKEKKRKLKRYALIGLATIGGGTLIGLTGGLAAPFMAAGAGAIIGGTGAAILGTTTGVALIGSLFGVAGAGLTGYKMKKRVGAIEEFEFEPLVCGNTLRVENVMTKQLHITIAITGWLSNQMKDFRKPWKNLAESQEQYTLRWETKYLVQLGEAMDYIFNSAMAMATQEALKYTVLQGILAAVAWPAALVSASNIIDNPWSVALQRSQTAGRMLAEVLLSREQGNRPVTLIGYSLGARVIYCCLEELSKRKHGDGIIEDVILLGTPATGDPKVWQSFAKVVSGKIVNGFCRGDWLLKFLYRTSSVQMSIAGLRPIKWADRRMHNIDLSDVVSGHMDYKSQLDTIMKAVGVRTRDEVKPTSRSSSKTSSLAAAAGPGSSDEHNLSIDELSSSDEEMFEGNEQTGRKQSDTTTPAPTEPVILEDYTAASATNEKKGAHIMTASTTSSSSQEAGGTSTLGDVAITESASFDSGVVINRAESEVRERQPDSADRTTTPEDLEPKLISKEQEQSLSTASDKAGDESVRPKTSSVASKEEKGEGLRDRVGDAGATTSDEEAEDLERPRFDSSDSIPDENKVEELTSNLQRKKLFDSMYRLVLDDDILDDLGDEDESTLDNYTPDKDTGNPGS